MTATLGTVKPHNTQTQAVIDRICGIRTKEEIIKEFFGLAEEDLTRPERLQEMHVEYRETLGKFGITQADFDSAF